LGQVVGVSGKSFLAQALVVFTLLYTIRRRRVATVVAISALGSSWHVSGRNRGLCRGCLGRGLRRRKSRYPIGEAIIFLDSGCVGGGISLIIFSSDVILVDICAITVASSGGLDVTIAITAEVVRDLLIVSLVIFPLHKQTRRQREGGGKK
jgi:hypothetical protein